MDNLNYNASHAPDPTARDAITAADEMPAKVHDAVIIIRKFLVICGLEMVGRIKIKDKDTGRIYK